MRRVNSTGFFAHLQLTLPTHGPCSCILDHCTAAAAATVASYEVEPSAAALWRIGSCSDNPTATSNKDLDKRAVRL